MSKAASAFGFSRPSWYAAAGALDQDGLPGRPGPRRAHKLTEEVIADVRPRRPRTLVWALPIWCTEWKPLRVAAQKLMTAKKRTGPDDGELAARYGGVRAATLSEGTG